MDARLDLVAAEQRQEWPAWMSQQVRDADFVLVIVSPAYKRRSDGGAAADEGRGAQFEARLIREFFYRDQDAGIRRFLPVLLPGARTEWIPDFLSPTAGTHYRVEGLNVTGCDRLLRVLTGQPYEVEPLLGQVPALAPRVAVEPGLGEFCAGLRQLQQSSGFDTATLARQLTIPQARLYAILNGEMKEPPDWAGLVGPLVNACTSGDARAEAEWRQRHAGLVAVYEELSRQNEQARPVSAESASAGQVVIGEIPQEPPGFVMREVLGRLAEATGRGRVAVVCAVTGLRGVGKTQLAASYARQRVGQGWGLVGWVSAETPDSLVAGLARVAGRLGVADPLGDSLESARRLREHLQARADDGLLVFDNAADAGVVRSFLPATGGTQVVITSTDQAFGELGEAVDVSVFTRLQTLGYLAARTGLADEGGAVAVADELGDLPLALAQAAATIRRQHLTYPATWNGCARCPSAHCWARCRAGITRAR